MPQKSYFLIPLLYISINLAAQAPLSWSLLPGIEGGPCHSVSYDPETGALFAVKVDGLYRSMNEGDQWEKVLDLGQGSLPYRHQFEVDAREGRVAVVRFESGLPAPKLYYSENLGNTWSTVALPAGTCSTGPIFNKIALFEDWILLNFGEGEGVYYSKDGGQNWTEPAFFQQSLFSTASPPPLSLVRSQNRLYLYSFFQIYYTDGNPEQWDTLPLPPGVQLADLKFANETKVLIADIINGQFYATYNTGADWTPVSPHPALHAMSFWYGQKQDTLLWGAEAIYRSVFPFTDATAENGLVAPTYEFIPFWTDHYLLGMVAFEGDDTGLYAVPNRGLYRVRLDTLAPTYTISNRGFPEGSVTDFFPSPKGMIALGPTGIFRYQEADQQWDTLWQSTEMPPNVRSVMAIEDTFWIIAHYGYLYKAIGKGSAFQQDLSFLPLLPSDISLNRLEFQDGVVYLFNPYRSLYSLDSARTWKPINDLWPFEFYQNIVGDDGHFLVVYRNPFGVLQCYMTHDWGATWTFLPDVKPDSEDRIYFKDGQFFAFDDFYNKGQPFLWHSSDNGFNWTKRNGVLPPAPPFLGIAYPVIFSSDSTLYFGQVQGNFYASDDFGETWVDMNVPGDNIPLVGMLCLEEHNGYVYIGTGALGVWRAAAPVSTAEPNIGVNRVSIVPNPAHTTIQATAAYHGPFVVYNAQGKIVLQGTCRTGQMIDISRLPGGTYWFWMQGYPLAPFQKY
ncbi:MAG: hypothetical protein JNN28_12705 [Saprospiraceae bacterium]|nr:hypothetical protein [Saprospiraceae bacterium]